MISWLLAKNIHYFLNSMSNMQRFRTTVSKKYYDVASVLYQRISHYNDLDDTEGVRACF